MHEHTRLCSYEVDAALRLVRVDDAWADFAVANAAPELAQPVGAPDRTLLSYIADSTTRQVYQAMFDRARAEGRPLTVPLRCDAPDLRRFLELTIAPREGGGFRLDSTLVRSEPRPYVALLDTSLPRTDDVLRMCGWCKAVEANGSWVTTERGVELLGLFERDALPMVTHGVCEECSERLAEEIDRDVANG